MKKTLIEQKALEGTLIERKEMPTIYRYNGKEWILKGICRGVVNYYADLPKPRHYENCIFYVKKNSHFLFGKRKGFYKSSGTEWFEFNYFTYL